MSAQTNSRGTKTVVYPTIIEVFEDDVQVTYRISNIETIKWNHQKEIHIIMNNGKEYYFGKYEDAGLQNHIRKMMSGGSTEDQIDALQERIDGLVDENDEMNKKITRLESLISDLLERMSVKSVPEGDLLG